MEMYSDVFLVLRTPPLALSLPTTTVEDAVFVKRAVSVGLLVVFWCWETWRPYLGQGAGRVRHAGHNLAIALFNTVVLGVVFGSLFLAVTEWTGRRELGLLNQLSLPGLVRFGLALVLLDLWMYWWHRANHAIPLLWRFHRMHHSDRHMDVTTATRFHLGEHTGSSILRLGLIPLLGLEIWHLVIYETLVVAVTQFHHADIGLGRFDPWLRLVIVTPDMHKMHHSDQRPETNSNYSTVLSIWDKLAGSFRMRTDTKTIAFGLHELTDPGWQTWWGMLRTPFVNFPSRNPTDRGADEPEIDSPP